MVSDQKRNSYHGKNIRILGDISHKPIPDLVLEATSFASVKDYARAFCRVYRLRSEFVGPITRTLRYYARQIHGAEWCRKRLDVGGKYMMIASRDLGVPTEAVIEHLIKNKINLMAWTSRVFDSPAKAYSYFYTRIKRQGGAEDAFL
ncbi:MAG: hypothetical protein K9K86_09845 [Pseudomonadales bacterium]|nr:hypothetical protein [Pseudomonadales bacterium]